MYLSAPASITGFTMCNGATSSGRDFLVEAGGGGGEGGVCVHFNSHVTVCLSANKFTLTGNNITNNICHGRGSGIGVRVQPDSKDV